MTYLVESIRKTRIMVQIIYNYIYSKYLLIRYSQINTKIRIPFEINPKMGAHFSFCKSSKFTLNGKLIIKPWGASSIKSWISLGENAELIIDSDFNLGPNCRIIVANNAKLYIGGKQKEKVSGMTENCMIMCEKEIHIGKDMLCAWNIFITDSNWHDVVGANRCETTYIGDHVWIAPNASILKCSNIGEGSIIGNGALVLKGRYPPNSLLSGSPAKIIKSDVDWRR